MADPAWGVVRPTTDLLVVQPGTAAHMALRAAWSLRDLYLSLEAPLQAEVVLLIDPYRDQQGAVVVTLTSTGERRVAILSPPGPVGFRADSVQSAVAIGERTWTCELAVPWEALGLSPSRVGVVGFDAIVRGSDGQGVARLPSVSTGAEPDPSVAGALVLDDNPIRLERAVWGVLHLGEGSVETTLRNTGPTKLLLFVETETSTPYALPEKRYCTAFLAPYQRLTFTAPVSCASPGRGRLSLRVREGSATGRQLFQSAADFVSDDQFRVEGIGWLSLSLQHRLAGRTPIEARLQAVDCKPRPLSQPPVTLETCLVGPLGAGEQRKGVERRTLDAIELATLQRRMTYHAEDLLAGEYAVETRVFRGETLLGAGRHLIRVSPRTEESLGLAAPMEALESLRLGSAGKPWPDTVRRGMAALAYRLERAWQLYDRGDLTTQTALRDRYPAVRAEAAEASRIAVHLRAGERPYGNERGAFLLAHWSEVDDTPQPYGLYVPETYADTRAAGLVVVLHGYDGGNSGFGFPTDPNDPYYAAARERGWLVAWPWGRGNQDWRDSGETDLYDLIEELQAQYSIDSSRIYLAGISMGGRGVWHHAARRPDVWAGVIPIAGASSGQVWTVWQEERLAPNLRNLPCYILHGGKDDVVPVEDARTMYRGLLELGYEVEYEEFPTRGHEGFGDAIPRVYQWMDRRRREAWPSRVTYLTEWLRWGQAYWVTVEGLVASGRLSSIDARIEVGNRLSVETDALTAFAVRIADHPGIDLREPVSVSIDGVEVWTGYLSQEDPLRFFRDAGRWGVACPVSASQGATVIKTRYTSGPMRRLFSEPFSLVYGTHGWDDGRILASYDMAKRTAERWEWWMWGRAEPRADDSIPPLALGRGGLLIYGGSDVNSVARRLRIPIDWQAGTAVRSAEPNPWNERYLAAVFAAPDADTLQAIGVLGELWPLPAVPFAAQDADFQTAEIDDEGRLWPKAEGSYDGAWRVPVLAPGVWVLSDRSWRVSHAVEEGWTEQSYDDSAWASPRVRLRKEFDDTCWHYAAIHKYGRLAQSFEYPAMAISSSDAAPGWRHLTHLRRAFVVDGAPSHAELRVYLDDEGEVYLNGRLVAALGAEDLVTVLDVTPLVRQGENIIAVRLRNYEYDGCVCLQLHVAF